MPSEIYAYRVFIASPGGLDQERAIVREQISLFNESRMLDFGCVFSSYGWEGVPGGMRRPQAAINEEIEQCDYMILMLGSRWGSNPAGDGIYTSGTEEEFHIAQDCLSKPDHPMADTLVLFKGVSDEQLRDPGDQLKKVLEFRQKLDDERKLFYKSFDDVDGLRKEVTIRLERWALDQRGAGVPRLSRGMQSIRPTEVESEATLQDVKEECIAEDSIEIAEKYASQGLTVQADAAFVRATADGDTQNLERYARFLRRTGRLSKSLEVNQQVLDKLSGATPEEVSPQVRARTLCNIGIIQRKTGDLNSSRASLREAVETARSAGPELLGTLAYALDNLSITVGRHGDDKEAAKHLEEALAVRERAGDSVQAANTLTNLARLYRRTGQLDSAKESCESAIAHLSGGSDKAALASAHAAMGEILEAEGDLNGAQASFSTGLSINESLGMPDLVALSLTQVSRVLIELGDLAAAERNAQRSFDENDRASNHEGLTASRHLLGRIYLKTDRYDLATGMLEKAADDYATMRNPTGEAWARLHLSQAQMKNGNEGVASEALARAKFLASGLTNSSLRAQVGLDQ
ncbi:tetratricopeptide repeat protein [Pseudonocardia ailaonensis]|uniref:tetratricopeptide repeat protein n=1 Tax=Pseudonocardia ailaonensis TaxID=367279 RepID=UPI0031D94611